MAVKEVIRMGHPTLRLTAETMSLEEIQAPETSELIQDLFDTMQKEQGIGIAAPQINISKQIALVGLPPEVEEGEEDQGEEEDIPILVVINPKIEAIEETLQGFWEGCLSVPGLRGFVKRPRKIKANFLDASGAPQEIILEGFLATIFQHEIDHLFGKLYVDRVEDPTLLSYNEEFEKHIAGTENDPEED
ncbi:MAG: peptide deformylase [Halobacteriovoraceae bacterium]|jgi:peptide deformylase|nr:peptide deformylase [Halobacteriovoraceae bacterium]MBT5092882.1 peptide deformylase [Halobacteriovoraceae bacterium]